MSKLFKSYDLPQEKILLWMGDQQSRLFVLVTLAFAEYYSISPPIDKHDVSDYYIVHAELFCQLVEAIYEDQRPEFFFEWFSYGAAIYEAIRGTKYEWEWRYPTHVPLEIRRQVGCSPE